MSKDNSQNFKEPKQKKLEEIYGTLREKLAIGRENKNLRHLTNKLFKEAKYDLRKDALNKGKDGYQESTEGLDRFAIYFEEKLGIENFSKTFEEYKKLKTSDKTEELKDEKYQECERLENNYKNLKQDLKNTRVLGVGKTALGKTKTLARNCLVSCARVVGIVGGFAVGSALAMVTAGLAGAAPVVFAGAAAGTKLGSIREALKGNIKNIDSNTKKKPDDTPALETKKTWKSSGKTR